MVSLERGKKDGRGGGDGGGGDTEKTQTTHNTKAKQRQPVFVQAPHPPLPLTVFDNPKIFKIKDLRRQGYTAHPVQRHSDDNAPGQSADSDDVHHQHQFALKNRGHKAKRKGKGKRRAAAQAQRS